jgi:hypothetical protein
MPGYPVFVAGVYGLGGGIKSVMVVQALMGGLIVMLTYLVGRRVSERVGLVGAALAAVDPLSIGFSAAFLSETPFTLGLMAAIWLCLRMMERAGEGGRVGLGWYWWRWIVLGVLWGAVVYLRASALWLIVPLAGATAFLQGRTSDGSLPYDRSHSGPRRLSRRASWSGAVLAVGVVFVMLTPWLVRNYGQFHSGPLRLTTLEGISLYEAVYPEADGGPKQDKIALPPEMRPLNEAQRNDEWNRRGWEYVRQEPLRIAKLALIKMGRTWSPWFNAEEFRAGPIQWGMTLWNVPVLALALVGLGAGMRREVAVLLVIPIGYFTAVHALFLGSVRYRAPLMPLVCLLAAQGIVHLMKWPGRGQRLTS